MERQHGGDVYGTNKIILDFSVNLNPIGMPESVRKAVAGHPEDYCRYPDSKCRELKKELALFYVKRWERYHGGYCKVFLAPSTAARPAWEPDDFICGNGAADLLYSLIFAMRPKKALLYAPTFGEYEAALRAAGCKITKINEGTKSSLPEDIDMVILGNPNNPTGKVFSAQEMEKWLAFCEKNHIFLVVDECFNWFLEEPERYSLAAALDRYRNVFILNAFTKIFAMAGLRLGFGICKNKEVMERIEGCRQPWSVSGAAMRGGIAALSEKEFLTRTRAVVAKERNFLSEGLKKLGFFVYPSAVNFLLFKRGDETDYDEYCRSRGILIRSCKDFDGLDDTFYRVAVKMRNENEALLKCLLEGRKSNG